MAPSSPPPFPPGLRGWRPLLLPFLVGAGLRFWNLSGQIVGGDELHALRAALGRPLGEILFRYEAPDLYMAWASVLNILSAAGLVLSEHWLRLPGMAAGLAALWVLPRLVARFFGAERAVVFAWLLALSPSLVLYSRIARSYMPLVLLGTTAALAFLAWHEGGGRRWLGLYLVAALMAVVLHPVAAPAVASPLAFAMFDSARHSKVERGRLLARTLAAAIGLTLGLMVWFGFARKSLLALIAERRLPLDFDLDSFLGLAMLQAGATRGWVAALFWLAALVGAVGLFRREPRLALFVGVLYGGPIAGLVVLSPVAGDVPLLFNRYTLLALPWLLLLVSEAGALLLAATPPRRAALLALTLGLAGWVGLGPLARDEFLAGSFAHHNDLVDFACEPARLKGSELPAAYRRLAELGPGDLIEAPWQPVWRFTRALPAYQRHHQRRVRVVSGDALLASPRTRLHGVLPTDEEAWLASGARFLVLHRNLAAEEHGLEVAPCAQRAGGLPEALATRLASQGEALASRLIRRWGPPRFAEGEILVWDLERVPGSPPLTSP